MAQVRLTFLLPLLPVLYINLLSYFILAYDGQGLAYVTAPRAALFRQYQSHVQSIDGAKWLLQYNNYLNDMNITHGDPAVGIASRYDLRETHGAAFGGLDSKVSSYSLLRSASQNAVITYAISGPTHEYLPPFTWDDWPNVTHVGQPTVWNFSWQPITQRFSSANRRGARL